MDLDPATLLAGLVVSGAGFVLFSYGRKLRRMPQFTVGVLLMAFPVFVGGPVAILATGVGLAAALWIALRLGL